MDNKTIDDETEKAMFWRDRRAQALLEAKLEVKQTPMETFLDLGGVFLNYVFGISFFGGMIYLASKLA